VLQRVLVPREGASGVKMEATGSKTQWFEKQGSAEASGGACTQPPGPRGVRKQPTKRQTCTGNSIMKEKRGTGTEGPFRARAETALGKRRKTWSVGVGEETVWAPWRGAKVQKRC